MLIKSTITEFNLPEYWVFPLMHGDYSGLTNEETKEVNDFLKKVSPLCPVNCSEDNFFLHRNDANSMGGNCLEFVFAEFRS